MLRNRFARRLQKLETRLRPDVEPKILQICFVSPDGSSVDGPRITVGPRPKKWHSAAPDVITPSPLASFPRDRPNRG
jgi:hypothetical protein